MILSPMSGGMTRSRCLHPAGAAAGPRACRPLATRTLCPGTCLSSSNQQQQPRRFACTAVQTEKEGKDKAAGTPELSTSEATEKYGLETGLFKVFTSKSTNAKDKTSAAGQLLKQYGGAYLLTSTSFAIVSFALCYAAVSAGIDVAALLSKVGLTPSDTSEKVGTFAIAYAAHKALSPVRFPPTVALTPVVARWLGQKGTEQAAASAERSKQDSDGNN